MSDTLKAMFLLIDTMIKNASIDSKALQGSTIDETFFDDYRGPPIIHVLSIAFYLTFLNCKTK